MSSFGGMDRGPEGDSPHLGRLVVFCRAAGEFSSAVVLDVREDGWTVSLRAFDTNDVVEFVPYGGGRELGRIDPGSWVTLDEYEGWKIYASERREPS